MIVTQFAAEINKELRARMNKLADHLAGGYCETIEQYRAVCGEIKGLAVAEGMLLDAAERMERVNDN